MTAAAPYQRRTRGTETKIPVASHRPRSRPLPGPTGEEGLEGSIQSELKQFKKYSPDKDPDPEEEEYWRHETKHSIS